MKTVAQLLKRFLAAGKPNAAPAARPAPLLLALEPRIVYDASVAAVGAAAHRTEAAPSTHHADTSAPAASRVVGEAQAADSADHHRFDPGAHRTPGEAAPGPKQVVFVDPSVSGYQALISGLPPGTNYVVLNDNADGLAQIAQYLEKHPGVDAIHLVSHGADGEIQVGSTWLNEGDLSAYGAELAQIGAAMKPGGDFLIYGCDVARQADGQALVQQVAALTGLNVAASTDATGAAALGGDWTLEYQAGNVHTPVIFSAAAEQQYGYVLGQTVETYDGDANSGNGTTVGTYQTSFTLDNITYTTDGAVTSEVATSNQFVPLSSGPTDGVLWINAPGDTPMTEVTITLGNGDPMAVTSFDFDEGLSTGTIELIPDGNASRALTLTGSQLSGHVDLSSNPNFKGITSLEILDVGDSGYFTPALNNFTYTDLDSPPHLTASGGTTAFVEGNNVAHTPSTPVAIDSGLTLSDGDSTTAQTATVAITGNLHIGQDVLAFTNTSSVTYGDIVGSYNSSTGVLSLSSSSGTATIAQWQAALRSVSYTDTSATPNTATRTISFSLDDGLGSAGSSNTVTKTVSVSTTDQIPIVTTTGSTTHYVGGNAPTTIDSGITVTDSDNSTQVSATVSISSNFHSGDLLSFNSTGADGNISAVYNAGTGTMVLSSAGGTATDAQWAAALSSITFSSTSTTYGNRTISFSTNDGTSNSPTVTDTVDYTAPPHITTDSGSANFVAGDNTTSTPVAVDSGLSVTDGSAGTLASATVSITGNFHSGEDLLQFTNSNPSAFGNIVASYSAGTGVLTLSSAGNSASLAQWQAALEAVTYTDTAVTPNNAARTIGFSVVDSAGNASSMATRTVTVTDTDQTPIVSTTGGTTLNYYAGTAGAAIDPGVTVSDLDNATQMSASVSVGAGFHSGDTLAFLNTDTALYGNIVGSYNAATGVLTLTSSSSTATDTQWANALSSVTFSSTSTAYGNRTISFATSDGTKTSVAATDTVNVSNPVVVTTDPGSASFVAGDNTASTPVAVDNGGSFSITDAAGATLQSVTVSITGNFQAGEDLLSFTNTSNATYGDVGASYDAGTGVLTLTSSGGATLAQWNNALKAVTYTDVLVTPNTGTRTIAFTAVDANGVASNTATRTVTVTDTDQTPVVSAPGSATNYVGGTSATTIDSGITVGDLDNSTQASATISITGGFHSGDTLAFTNSSSPQFGNIVASYNPATGVLTLTSSGATASDTQWGNALSAVTFFSSSTSYGNRTLSFVVNDGTQNSAAATHTVDVLGPPQLTTDSGSAAFVAGDNVVSTPVSIDSGLVVTDGSASTLAAVTVSISGNFHSGEDVLSFTNSNPSAFGNIVGTYDAPTGVLTLTSSGNSATLAQWQAALEAVTYTDTAVMPNNAMRTISFTAVDINGTASNTATRTVTVTDIDQTPIVSTVGGTTNYVGGTSATTIDGGITVSDLDNSAQASATVSVTSGFHSGDTLSFTNSNTAQFGNIVASYDAATGVMTLTSAGATASNAQWSNALSAVTFSSTSASYGDRTVSFVVNDGIKNSAAATNTVDVLGPPQITTDSGSAAFVAGDNVASTPVSIDSGLSVTDGSASTLASATVSISGNFHSGEDVLSFLNTSSASFGNIVSSYDAGTGVLTLTSAGNSASLAQWQAALDAVTYTDTAITPNNATRTISFTAVDTGGTTSNTATRTVTVTDIDQTPIVSTTGGTTTYVGGTSARTIDGGVTVSDLDNTTQASASVSIGAGFNIGDTLTFSNTNGTAFGNIAASYDAATGVLTLTSTGATATDAQWANALSAVAFSSTSTSYGNRTISFATNDGTKTSAVATDTVLVLGPPQITTGTGPVAFVAGDNVASAPVAIGSGLTVTDGSPTTLDSATVAITGNFHSGEDVLAFANTNGASFGNIAASYDTATGVLTLTSSGNSATLAQWQAALNAVTYTDTAVTPNNATRTISFTATDGNGTTSNTATRAVTITDTDQTPIVAATGGTKSYVGGTSATTIDSGIAVSDLDNATQASASVSIGSGFHSGDTLAFANTNGTTFGNITASYDAATGVLTLTSAGATATNAQWASALSAIAFASTSTNYGNRTISFVTNDGTKTSAATTDTVDVLGPPQVTTDPGSAAFVAGDNTASTPVVIDSGLGIEAGSSSTLATATVSITGNFHSGEDVLAFSNTDSASFGNIAASYNAATGVLTLTSAGNSATLAQWQAALDSVTYTDTAVTPNNATRTIGFTVTDSNGAASVVQTRDVTVTDTDQTPIATGGSTVTFTAGGVQSSVSVFPNVTVSDLDNTTLSSAEVRIAGGFDPAHDVLSFTGNAATGSIAGSYDAATGILTLTAGGPGATLAQWQAAFAAVKYAEKGSVASGTRTIAMTVSDGMKSSAPVTSTVQIETALIPVSPPAAAKPLPESGATEPAPLPTHSSAPSVLDEFDPSVEIGGLPPVITYTFTSPQSPHAFVPLGVTSVSAPSETLPADLDRDLNDDLMQLALSVSNERPLLLQLADNEGGAFKLDVRSVLTAGTGIASAGMAVSSVRLADGKALPAWLHYDAATGSLAGTVPRGAHDIRLAVQGHDAQGHAIRREVILAPHGRHATHSTNHPAPHASRDIANRVANDGRQPMPSGKPSLARQFAQARAALHVARPAVAAVPNENNGGRA